jgi:hypothetical protein
MQFRSPNASFAGREADAFDLLEMSRGAAKARS